MESKIIDMCLYYIHDMLHCVVAPSPFVFEYFFCHSRGVLFSHMRFVLQMKHKKSIYVNDR